MRKIGDEGERIAQEYLLRNGYKILTTNFIAPRIGEIDIIAGKDGKTLFVEVKYRRSERFWAGEYAITPQKLARIRATIEHYCHLYEIDSEQIQFDILIITKKITAYEVKHYRNQSIWEY